MAVPVFEEFLYPFLNCLKAGQKSVAQVRQELSNYFNLSEADLAETTKSGNVSRFNDRLGWVRQYLRRAMMIDIPQRGIYKITDRGLDYLQNHNDMRIDDLMKYEEFYEFATKNNNHGQPQTNVDVSNKLEETTPTDQLEAAFETIQNDLANDLLCTIYEKSPEFFEHLVVDLLLKMGYGDSSDYSGMVTPISHDGGIDGIIPQDKLGFDKIYIQAKRYASDNIVGRSVIQSFSGALAGLHATKGVFITTSSYSKEARQYVENLNQTIILIDGKQLARYMIEYNVGVSTKKVYEVKKIDQDYFEE